MNHSDNQTNIIPKILCIALIIVVGLLCISSAQGSIGELLNAGGTHAAPTLPINIPTVRPTPSYTSPNGQSASAGETPAPSPTATARPVLGQLTHNGAAEEIAHHTDSELEFIITRVTREKLVYYTVELALTSPYQLLTAFAGNRITNRDYTSNIAQSNDALLAINGDFCGYNSNGIIIRNGILYRDTASTRSLAVYDSSGNFSYIPEKDADTQALIDAGVFHTFSFGPVLVENSQATSDEVIEEHFLSHRVREPRTAIGQLGPLHYLILVVDGRQDASQGMLFSELQDTFVSYGVISAYNLDGGGSSTLYYNGEVINSPCVEGERKVSDIIFFKGA